MNGSEHVREHPAAVEAMIFDVLMAHQRIPMFDARVPSANRCVGCDNLSGASDGSNSPSHTAHLATHVAEALAAAGLLADRRDLPVGDGLREAVAALLATATRPTPHSNTAQVNAGRLDDLRAALATGTGTQGGGGM